MNIEQLKQGQQITIEGDILDVKAWQYQIYWITNMQSNGLILQKSLYILIRHRPYADISDKFGDLADQYQVKAEDVISILNEESKEKTY